ncbi:hypothetical protein M2F95_21665 [Vibrio vulnificus]|nr:hypothetical protein [Vibrio vulnificus]MCU8120520.1 hypothetical protein [Vibrio vulnificus]MCU8225660.1 hypothetical protein [Vibrio vulnificus]MCU8273707.1 hypothetical protein [Vibrio vulnificus]MCU8356994.1 hypothetical protein [Vibrio vulnificus]
MSFVVKMVCGNFV